MLAKAAKDTSAITEQQMGSKVALSCIDVLMVTLTEASSWFDIPMKGVSKKEIRPSIATHDVDGAFN